MAVDPLIGALTDVLHAHNFADADTCTCGYDYSGTGSYERHQAEVYFAAIAATGRLLPEGVATRVRHASRGTDGEIQVIWGSGDQAAEFAARDAKEHGTEHVTQRQYATPWEATS